MAKLPTSLLPRSLPSSTLLTSTSRPTTTAAAAAARGSIFQARPSQVRHATEVVRPKRPYTWTQIVQLSDGSTYTTRTTSPLPVYRSTKDTRNHLRWQPTEVSLQNVEVDEAGKLAGFRQRFGTGFDATPAPAAVLAAKEMKEDAERRATAVKPDAEGIKDEAAAEDSLESLLVSYTREQPSLKGGQVAGKGSGKSKKKK